MNIRILLVEDEKNLLEAIKLNLEMEGYEVVTAVTGTSAISTFDAQRFNLIILDIMLPEADGYRVCETIRLTDTETPILFLTAKDSSEDKVKGLKLGADDYLTKPFNLEEFLLRVKILARRSLKVKEERLEKNVVRFGGNEIDFTSFTAKGTGGKKIILKQREAALLKLLIERKNEVVSRSYIFETIWKYDVYPTTRTIDNFILTFRKYFEKDSKRPKHFLSVRGVGYQFKE